MADEIKLKAPTVEQQVVVNINGEEKLRSFADTLEKISNNKNLQKYWKTQQELINATADAYGNFSKKASQDNAKELIKVTNALKAMSGTDLSNILPDFDKISKAMAEAQKVAGNIDSAFSIKGFKEAFDSFETLKAYGVDIQNLFSHFGVSSDVGELQKNVRALEGEVEKLTRRLANAKNANEELRNEFDNFKSGSGFADKLDELDNLKSEMSYLREQAEETFRQFLKLNNITEDGYDRDGFYDDNRFKEYFQNIQSGYLSASDAIQQFKREYSYLLDDSFKSNNDTFGLEQLQTFSNKLDSIFRQVEETSTKINDIISNGVITKSVENLSMDSSLSDSQRSLFGNLLQDEESLKSITALFQKLIEESNKTSKVDLFNDEQLQQVLSIFDKMEGHLSSLRSIISDVGDGEEFSPLLKMINNVQSSISELTISVKGIGLNMNIDVGSDSEMEAKVQSKIANALQAYQRLFDHIKMSSVGGSIINTNFFEFDINQYDTMMGKLQAYKKFIDNMRKEAKARFNGQDVLYQDTEKSYWTQASAAMGQVTRAFNEMNAASDTNPLKDLFGSGDLSEVISQLGLIVAKLEEISTTASSFKNVFDNGFNVTASVEEIDKLTNRVKELEDELSKIKLNPVNVDKSNISSGTQIKDVFQGDKIDQVTTSAKELDNTLEQVNIPTDSFDEVLSKLDLAKSELGEIVKITKQSVSDSEGKFHDSYTLKDKRGSTEIYGLSSNTEKGQLLRSNIVGYDAKAEAQESKRLIEENIRLNKAYYDSKKQEEVEYQRLRAKYLAEGKAQEKKYYADLQKSADNTKLEEQKRIYKELNDSLDRYATVSKRIASGNALGSDEEEAAKLQTRIEELQNSPILSKEQLELSQSKLEKIETTLEDIQKITKETTLDSLQSEIDSFNKDYDNRNIKPTDENRSIEYQQALDKYLASIKELTTEKERLSKLDSISEEELSHYKELKGVVQENAKALKAMSSAQKGSDALSRGKEIDTITKYLNKFTGISKQAKQELKGLLDQLQSGDPSVNVKKIHERFLELTAAERNAGREARNLFDIFKDKKIYSFLGQAASMFSFYDLISLGREGFQTIREIDTALVDLKKTTAMNSSQLEDFYFDSNDVAKQMGVTTQAIIEQASAWSRLGYNTKESSTQMAELSSQFAAISPDMDLDTATDGLVSSMKAFDIEVSNVERDIMDNINRIGNTAATSNGEIVDMLTRSSAAMAAANNTIQETIALETAAVEITRNAETTGTAFKTLSMRIRGRQTLPPYTVMYMLCA